MYLEPRYVDDPSRCFFYHTMDVPGLGLFRGQWDLRGHFDEYDYILAMDRTHLRILRNMAPEGAKARLGLFLEASGRWKGEDVPDPFYGGAEGFERVLDMVEEAAERWLDRIEAELDPGAFRLQESR